MTTVDVDAHRRFFFAMLLLGLFVLAAIEWFVRFKNAQREARWVRARMALRSGQYSSVPEDDLFFVLSQLFEDLVVATAKLTNRRIASEQGSESSYVVTDVEHATRKSFGELLSALDLLEYDAAIGAFAFSLKATHRQLQALRAKAFIPPVRGFLAKVWDGFNEVRYERWRFAFDSRTSAIVLLCNVFRDLQELLDEVERLELPSKPPGRGRRGPSRKKQSDES